jgi:hypothetical protein
MVEVIEKPIEKRCYNCHYYKPLSDFRGWCKDNRNNRKSIRVNAVDFCPDFEEVEK